MNPLAYDTSLRIGRHDTKWFRCSHGKLVKPGKLCSECTREIAEDYWFSINEDDRSWQ